MTRDQLRGKWSQFVGGLRKKVGAYAGNPRLEVEGEIQMERGHQQEEQSERDHYLRDREKNQPPPRPRELSK